MIIWRGFGFAAAIIPVVIVVLTQLITDGATGDPAYYKTHGWIRAVALLVAAVLVYFVGRKLNGTPGRTVIDKQTGREIILKQAHSMFFIPVEFWAYIIAVFAVISFFAH
jgi:hypothetical protein